MKKLLVRLSALSVVGFALASLAGSLSAAGGGGGSSCPDVYDPVICNNGVIYGNLCYATKAKAKGCVPWGDD